MDTSEGNFAEGYLAPPPADQPGIVELEEGRRRACIQRRKRGFTALSLERDRLIMSSPGAVSTLLRLTSRGNSLVAELLRLSDHVPPLFSLLEKQEQKMIKV